MDAMVHYAQGPCAASAGRGGYVEAVETGKIIADCRAKLRKLFNGEKNENFIFTLNCSHALNLAIKGLFNPPAHRPPSPPTPSAPASTTTPSSAPWAPWKTIKSQRLPMFR